MIVGKSFETLKGVGKASGTAFRFMFMGAHMAVENHGEVIGEFLQRRVNFIVSALGSINPTEFSKASQTIDIETELVPYMIDDLNATTDSGNGSSHFVIQIINHIWNQFCFYVNGLRCLAKLGWIDRA